MKNTTETIGATSDKYVNVAGLLKALWEIDSAPSAGWIYDHVRAGNIPCVEVGSQKYFSVDEVREAFVRKAKFRVHEIGDPKRAIRAAFEHNKAEQRRRRELAPFSKEMRAEG